MEAGNPLSPPPRVLPVFLRLDYFYAAYCPVGLVREPCHRVSTFETSSEFPLRFNGGCAFLLIAFRGDSAGSKGYQHLPFALAFYRSLTLFPIIFVYRKRRQWRGLPLQLRFVT